MFLCIQWVLPDHNGKAATCRRELAIHDRPGPAKVRCSWSSLCNTRKTLTGHLLGHWQRPVYSQSMTPMNLKDNHKYKYTQIVRLHLRHAKMPEWKDLWPFYVIWDRPRSKVSHRKVWSCSYSLHMSTTEQYKRSCAPATPHYKKLL